MSVFVLFYIPTILNKNRWLYLFYTTDKIYSIFAFKPSIKFMKQYFYIFPTQKRNKII